MSEESQTPEPTNPQATPPSPEPAPAAQLSPEAPVAGDPYIKENTDKKLLTGILAIVLGTFGVHKFILGYKTEGIIMAVVGVAGFFICGIPSAAVWIVGLIEGIIYLTKTDKEFVDTYVVGRKPWF